MNNPKLCVELIPKTCWFSSVRANVKPVEWDKIRKFSYENANNLCEICGSTGKKQGYKHNVEAHEIFKYDEKTKTQVLERIISLCPRCHQCKHIGRSIAIGLKEICYKHLMLVNKWKIEDVEKHIKEAYEIYKKRSKIKWELDISLLSKAPYNIKLKLTENRKFKPNKFFKKKTKKKVKKPKR